MKKLKIVKLGGSVITKKSGYKEPNIENIEALVKMLAGVWKRGIKIIVVHGAGSFGHRPVMVYGIEKGIKTEKDRVGYSYTHSSCAYLSSLVVDALIKYGVPSISIPPAVIIKQKNGRIKSFNKKIVYEYLKAGFLPVLYGDMVLDEKLGGSVCSGDKIVAELGKDAEIIVLGTNVDGVLADGKVVEKITRKNFEKVSKHLGGAGTTDVTGGMRGKILEIMKARRPAYVVNALHPNRIEALLLGKKKPVCTEISGK
ncbi:MAG: isopentenyl phosphate kinase [Candidatus Anstonellales archaeon]